MFLDEELNKIYEEGGHTKATSTKLVDACLARLEKDNGVEPFLNSLKRIDASWRLFCKTHKEYDPNGFRIVILHNSGNLSGKLIKALNWNINDKK